MTERDGSGRGAQRLAIAIEARSRAIARTAARHPRHVFAGWLIATAIFLPGLFLLERSTDGLALLPASSDAVATDRAIRHRFDLRDQIVVAIGAEGPKGVLDPAVLADIHTMTLQAQALEGVGRRHVLSLATEPRDRLYPGSGQTFGSFVDPLPRSAAETASLAADLDTAAAALLTGSVVSADRRHAAILVGAPDDLRQRGALVRELEALASSYRRPGMDVSVVGAPVATALLADHILRDLVVLIPLSLLVVAVIIWLGTRSAAAVAIALGKVGACVAWTFGVLGVLGVPVYLTVTIVPVILAAMCIADEVHLLIRYQQELRRGGGRERALERTIHSMAAPVVVATSTTCVGFLSCLATGLPPLQALGAGAGLGTAYSLFFSLTVTPALFATLPTAWLAPPRGGASRARRSAAQARLGHVSRAALDRPVTTLVVLAALTALAVAGTRRVQIQDSWIDCFAPRSDFRRATARVNETLDGVHLLHVHLALDDGDGSLLDPRTVARLAKFEAAAGAGPTVGDAIGLVAHFDAVAAFWRVPDWRSDEDEARHLASRFDFAPGEARRRRVLSDGLDETVLTLFLENANYRDTAALMAALNRAHREHLQPLGIDLEFAGDVAVSQALIPAVVRGQMVSLPLTLLGVLASVFLLCGSLRLAVAALMPVTASALWLLGGLGWAGFSLGVATSTFFAISIGLGVDSHSIHLIMRYRERWLEGDGRPARAALREVRPAILLNSLAVTAGFGLLAASTVPPNRSLGLLVAAAVVLGCAITLTGLAGYLELLSRRSVDSPARDRLDPHHERTGPEAGEGVLQ